MKKRFFTHQANGNWRLWRAWWQGAADGFEQVELSVGITWDDADLNEAYDLGANAGEWLAWLLCKRVQV